mgnify:CR=1 FL=1
MVPELFWLILTTLMTGVLWIPYILQMIKENGVAKVLKGTDGTPAPKAPWAVRMKKAHVNAVENLVVFAPLVIIIAMTGAYTAMTAPLAMVYFFARLVHVVVYTLGIPAVKTVAFIIGSLCQIGLALTLLGFM